MDPSTGTFISMDSYQGSIYDPVTLHKYLYANANPVMYTDPSGYSSLKEKCNKYWYCWHYCGGICLCKSDIVKYFFKFAEKPK